MKIFDTVLKEVCTNGTYSIRVDIGTKAVYCFNNVYGTVTNIIATGGYDAWREDLIDGYYNNILGLGEYDGEIYDIDYIKDKVATPPTPLEKRDIPIHILAIIDETKEFISALPIIN